MQLGLGTVQFGLDYGVTNTKGRASEQEAHRILSQAHQDAVLFLDTAPAYGTSESIIGSFLTENNQAFRLITKTPHLKVPVIGSNEIDHLLLTFHRSREALNSQSLYACLVHHPDNLIQEGSERVYESLKTLQLEGYIEKIGVSVYDAQQIEQILERFPVDVIQVPFNVLDQRLHRSGHLKQLKQSNIEVHVRSIFLQGILLSPVEVLPGFFADLQPALIRYRQFLQFHSLSPLEGVFSFLNSVETLDVALVGVTSLIEYKEIALAWQSTKNKKNIPWEDLNDVFSMLRLECLDPRLWPPPMPR